MLGWDGSKDSLEFRRLVDDIATILGPSPTTAEAEESRKVEEEHLREQEQQRSEEEARRKAEEANRRRIDQEVPNPCEPEPGSSTRSTGGRSLSSAATRQEIRLML